MFLSDMVKKERIAFEIKFIDNVSFGKKNDIEIEENKCLEFYAILFINY